jgi:hypothetical protein
VDGLVTEIAYRLSDPLTAVLGFSELVLAHSDLPPDCRADLEAIARHARCGSHTVHELLGFIRLRERMRGAGQT